ncbi:blue copper protein-like [Prosopis cineraria]|uniref:blue copper protein-like n=1 Tax=Prosopis cineraria TaxID=364024 RepID=UPI00240F9315|nr:blue copper protein-like [Prosopis cineraria]
MTDCSLTLLSVLSFAFSSSRSLNMAMPNFTQAFLFSLLVISATAVVAGAANVHHVVGGDRGWDPSSDLSAWSSARTFRVGDEIWFSYSATEGVIAEVKSKEEYESCDSGNPINMYTDGLHAIPLEKEGIRYFLSTEPQHCNNGLKLHVQVQPMMNPSSSSSSSSAEFDAVAATKVGAEGPSTPSASPPHNRVSPISITILMFCVSIMFHCA